jgi:HPt (histidine-containing phosphotransfer) domain-containing protein
MLKPYRDNSNDGGDMQEQAIIDMSTIQMLKETMGDEFIFELIDTYNTETTTLIVQLRKSLADGESASFCRYAHSIKSSSASLGAFEFSQQAYELEMMGKSNNLRGASSKVDQLAASFLEVKRRLEDIRNEA